MKDALPIIAEYEKEIGSLRENLDVILSYDYAQDAEVYFFFDRFIEINKAIENPLRDYNKENDKHKELSDAQKNDSSNSNFRRL